MKRQPILKIWSLLLICFLAISCKDNDDKKHVIKIDVTVCGQKNPEWLQVQMDHIAETLSDDSAVYLYCLQTDQEEYIAIVIQQLFSSQYPNSLQFFDCSGEKIISTAEAYELHEKFMANEFERIWEYSCLYER